MCVCVSVCVFVRVCLLVCVCVWVRVCVYGDPAEISAPPCRNARRRSRRRLRRSALLPSLPTRGRFARVPLEYPLEYSSEYPVSTPGVPDGRRHSMRAYRSTDSVM